MAGPVTLKLKEIQATLELIKNTITNDFDPITFRAKQLLHRNLTLAQIEGEICDLKLRWTSTRNRALEAQANGTEPWTRKNRNKLNTIITAMRFIRNTVYKAFDDPKWFLGNTQELLSSMRELKWDYMRDKR